MVMEKVQVMYIPANSAVPIQPCIQCWDCTALHTVKGLYSRAYSEGPAKPAYTEGPTKPCV